MYNFPMLPCLALFLAVLFIGADSISFTDSLSVIGGGKRVGMTDTNVRFFLVFFFFIGKFQRRSPANLVLMELRFGRNERRKSFNFPNAHLTLQTRVRFVLPQRGWRAASFPSRWHGRLTMCCTIEIPPQQKRIRKRDCAEKLGELYKLGDDRTARGRASYARYKNGRL